MIRDTNDPRQLGVAILQRMHDTGCTAAEAADYLYEDMAKRGYNFRLIPDPARPLNYVNNGKGEK